METLTFDHMYILACFTSFQKLLIIWISAICAYLVRYKKIHSKLLIVFVLNFNSVNFKLIWNTTLAVENSIHRDLLHRL